MPHLEAARDAVRLDCGRDSGQAAPGNGRPGRGRAWSRRLGSSLPTTRHGGRSSWGADGEIGSSRTGKSPGDPDLHTHFLVPNAVFCESWRVGSLDTGRIRGFIFEADAFYQARLARTSGMRALRSSWTGRTGAARLPVIPDEIRKLFSKRTAAGELLAKQFTRERGEDWDALAPDQREARTSRPRRTATRRSRAARMTLPMSRTGAGRPSEPAGAAFVFPVTRAAQARVQVRSSARAARAYEVAQELLAEEFERRSVLTQWDVRTAAARGLVHAGIRELADIGAVTALMRAEGVRNTPSARR